MTDYPSNIRQVRNFINGEFVEGSDAKTFENRYPATNEIVGVVHEASKRDVDAAVRAARAAFEGPWGSMPLEERLGLLEKVADGVKARLDEFVAAEVADSGKPRMPTLNFEVPRGAEQFRLFADVVRNVKPLEEVATRMPDGGTAINRPERSPRGVVAAICPWNIPFIQMSWKVAPALASGNTIIVKPSEETPTTAALLGEVMNEAGIPPGVFNVVHGFGPGSAGEFLSTHPGVDGITFTGETETGAAIMRAAAGNIKALSLELGGKNPGIIFADANFEAAVAGAAAASFFNCGQLCLSTERLYVERPIFDDFVAALKEKAEALKCGDPNQPATSLGPLSSRSHQEKVLTYYGVAAAEGAAIVTGGGRPDMADEWSEGAWVQPTIWTGLPETSRTVKEEIFGPCCHVAPFDTEDEALSMANATDYGLAAMVWGGDAEQVQRVASKIQAGIVWVNCWLVRELRSPFGGFKQSGIGREGGEYALEFFTEIRNVCTREG
ncbi:MAG: 2-hydroxymuconic semialdehyde dehydrogenase [Sphingomonadales bacterium]